MAPHLLSLLLLLLYILYNIYIYYNYTHTKYDICLHYTVSCEEAMLYTNSCIYYSYTICICMLYPLWYMTMYYNLTYYINILYYYYYNNHNSYLFLFFIFIIMLLYVCMRVCVVLCCLSCVCVYVCSLVCPRICSYMCICVCLPRLTLLDCAAVKRLMCWYKGGIFREKIFTKFGKWVYHVKTDRKSIFDLGKR